LLAKRYASREFSETNASPAGYWFQKHLLEMTMTTMQQAIRANFKTRQVLVFRPELVAGRGTAAGVCSRPLAEWERGIPTRAAKRTQPFDKIVPLPLVSGTPLQKLTVGLLVSSFVVAVGYGFSSMIGMVQSWSVFEGLTSRLVQ
jgi:hypothetical protein